MRALRRLILALLFPAAALAADTTPSATPAGDPVMERYNLAAARKDWAQAAALLRDAVAAEPSNANYHNLYAYALRKSASPDMNLVFKHYNEALKLDPRHRGAHEYIGEAYLMVGNVGKAKEHLGQLDKLCFFGCTEHAELKKAIGEFEAKRK